MKKFRFKNDVLTSEYIECTDEKYEQLKNLDKILMKVQDSEGNEVEVLGTLEFKEDEI